LSGGFLVFTYHCAGIIHTLVMVVLPMADDIISVANNVGLNDRQLHLILVENCADCRLLHLSLFIPTSFCK
jgi:hypothetical protein